MSGGSPHRSRGQKSLSTQFFARRMVADGSSPNALRYSAANRPELTEAAAKRNRRDGGIRPPTDEFLARPCQPHAAHPAERRSAEKHLEMCLQGPRTNVGSLGKQIELNGFGKVTAKPAQSAHEVCRQGAGECLPVQDSAVRINSGHLIACRYHGCSPAGPFRART